MHNSQLGHIANYVNILCETIYAQTKKTKLRGWLAQSSWISVGVITIATKFNGIIDS